MGARTSLPAASAYAAAMDKKTMRASIGGASLPFKGNKAALPSKPCLVCGRPMTWRRRWAKNWAEVKVCSEACRRLGKQGKHSG
jgi:hypothetical protein